MKLSLQYTSDIDKLYIKEAERLRNSEDARNNGWSYLGSGIYKNSYRKGNVVVKFSRYDGDFMTNEIEFYKKSPRKHKKYLARIFGGNRKKIIQKFIDYDKNHKYSKKESDRIYRLGKEINMIDYAPGLNAVKTKDSSIVFFDFGGQTRRH